MSKGARQRADDLHSEILPKFHRRFVGRDDKVELHRAEAKPARLLQAMLAHRPADPLPARVFPNDECSISDMRTAVRLVRMQSVTTNNFVFPFSDTNVRIVFEPVSQRIHARNVWINRIRLARGDHFLKNLPDSIAIRVTSTTNVKHRCLSPTVCSGGCASRLFINYGA